MLGQRECAFVIFVSIAKLPSVGVVPVALPPPVYESAYFLTVFTTECISCLDFCQSSRWKVNLCNFNLHFSYEWGWTFCVFKTLGSFVNFPGILDSWSFSYFLGVLYILGQLAQFNVYPLTLFMDFFGLYTNFFYVMFIIFSFIGSGFWFHLLGKSFFISYVLHISLNSFLDICSCCCCKWGLIFCYISNYCV